MATPNPTDFVAAPLFKRLIRPLTLFFQFEAAGGVLLLVATVVAMAWGNSGWSESYERFLHLPFSVGSDALRFNLHQLVNDGLMTIFFFVVGMEIKREMVVGELRTVERALLPAVAAAGGMVIPALIFVAFNWGTKAMSGWAIPMATDIAFSIGVVTLLKARVPWALIVFLTALAIFDDIGGIIVIAVFYGSGIHVEWLFLTAGVVLVLAVMGRMHVGAGLAYLAGGIALWYCVHHAGIHATLSGVALGMLVPARARQKGREVLTQLHAYLAEVLSKPTDERITNDEILQIEERLEDLEPPLNRFIHALHPYVAFFIVPLFALVNAGVDLRGVPFSALLSPVPLGIALGLFVGKQLGIFAFTLAFLKARKTALPGNGSLPQLWGISAVAGIGFTVALFVASLAFADDQKMLNEAKLGILVGSFASALVGYLVLRIARAVPGRFSAPEEETS